MKATTKIILIAISFVFINCTEKERNNHFVWNLEKEKIQNENRNSFSSRDIKTWNVDIQNFVKEKSEPLENGVFPVPKYDMINSNFAGAGTKGKWDGLKLKNKTLIHHSFFIKKCNINKEFIPNKEDEVFFTIISITDSIDLKNYTHTSCEISSRNHPHFIGQGFIKSKKNHVDFLSFITADRNSYAIVNMRIFDLRIGCIVLIAPRKDGTFRSLQLNSEIHSSDEINNYIEDLIKKENVISFFTESGNI